MKPNPNNENSGPDNYTLELETLVLEGLGKHLRSFSIDVSDDGIILRGGCNSFHVKQLAQEIVSKNTSLQIVANDLVVESSPDRRSTD